MPLSFWILLPITNMCNLSGVLFLLRATFPSLFLFLRNSFCDSFTQICWWQILPVFTLLKHLCPWRTSLSAVEFYMGTCLFRVPWRHLPVLVFVVVPGHSCHSSFEDDPSHFLLCLLLRFFSPSLVFSGLPVKWLVTFPSAHPARGL